MQRWILKVINLKSNKGKNFKSKNIPLILQSDLLNAPISGCSNPFILGGPCTLVSVIPPPALSLKKFNGEGAPLQEFVPLILTDKGNPLICTPKPNQFKLFQPAIPIDKQSKGENGEIEIKLERPRLRLQYKDNSLSIDHIPLYRIFSNDEEITSDHSKSNPQGNNPPPNGTQLFSPLFPFQPLKPYFNPIIQKLKSILRKF